MRLINASKSKYSSDFNNRLAKKKNQRKTTQRVRVECDATPSTSDVNWGGAKSSDIDKIF